MGGGRVLSGESPGPRHSARAHERRTYADRGTRGQSDRTACRPAASSGQRLWCRHLRRARSWSAA
eukprot:5379797-Pyramimonas_sp.AAC.1